MVQHTDQNLPILSFWEKEWQINDQESKIPGHLQRGKNPSDEGHDREESSHSKNRISVKKKGLQMCKGQQSGIWESPEASKVLLMVHEQLEPARLPLLSVDWRAAPCVLTASLWASRKTINPPTPPLRRGKVKLGIPPLSLSVSLTLTLSHCFIVPIHITNLAAVLEPPCHVPVCDFCTAWAEN